MYSGLRTGNEAHKKSNVRLRGMQSRNKVWQAAMSRTRTKKNRIIDGYGKLW